MRHIFCLFCLFLCTLCKSQATLPEPPDTLSGVAIVLEAGGVMTFDTATRKMVFRSEPEGILVPVRCICVRTPIDMVPASARGQNVGYVTRFYRKDNGQEIPADDVLMFKIR